MRANYAKEKERLARETERVERLWRDIQILEYQIKEAKQRGKDGFDAEKFCKSLR